MKTLVTTSADALRTAIWALDLGPIRFKMLDPTDGEGWPMEKVDLIEEDYRRFLLLIATRPEPIVPTKDIDTFWHNHILDTMKYHEDCEALFGFYLHHFPYFGVRSDADAANLESASDVTKRIWTETFDVPPITSAGYKCTSCSSDDDSACSSCVDVRAICGSDRPPALAGGNTCGTCGGQCTACSAVRPGMSPNLVQTSWRPSA